MEIPTKTKKTGKNTNQKPNEQLIQFFTVNTDSNPSEYEVSVASLSYQNNFKELLTGFIPKKTMNMAWTERYFTLTPTRIIYYTNKLKHEVKGCFNLISLRQHNVLVLAEYPVLTLAASIKSSKDVTEEKQLLKLNIEDKEEYMNWMIGIRQILYDKQNKNPKIYPTISSSLIKNPQLKGIHGNFWNKITLSIPELHSYANHLDIIFFRTKNNPSSFFQRLLMRSYFDHVGILLKNQIDQLFVLEAIQSRGVWVNQWTQLLPSLKDVYEEIGYRKLYLPDNFSINFSQLEEYLNSLIGKKYELSLTKLMSHEEETMQQKKETTYFCSELIADIYIKFGLIKDRRKNDFWPRDFENSLKLQLGARLSPLMEVQF